jgi:hypothetical protein
MNDYCKILDYYSEKFSEKIKKHIKIFIEKNYSDDIFSSKTVSPNEIFHRPPVGIILY